MCMYIHVCMYVCLSVCMYACMYVCTYVYMHACMYVYVYRLYFSIDLQLGAHNCCNHSVLQNYL
jgi:hypothetical protein